LLTLHDACHRRGMPLDPSRHLAAIRSESDRLATVAREVPSDARVPTCPDWTVADLVRHIGGVQYWVAATVERRAKERIPFSEVPQPPQDRGAVIDWFAAATGSLLIALEEAGPDELAWNFAKGPDQPVRWWYRRQAAEVAVHRQDAEAAAATADPLAGLDPEVAADALDELLVDFLPFIAGAKVGGWNDESIHVHRTDGEGEWLLRLYADGKVDCAHEHGKGDVAVRGSAAALLAWASNRALAESLEVHGDVSLLDRWRDTVRM